MNKRLYPRLALSGIKKNFKLYLPYLCACIGMTMVFYITAYLANSEFVAKQPGGAAMSIVLRLGWIILGAFSAILLFYTSSFLMKRRKTEFGLYNILGMSRVNISFILIFENLFILIISLIVGISLGVLFSKLMEILLINMVGGKNTLDFRIDFDVIFKEIVIYAMLFAMILFKGVRQVSRTNAITLFQSNSAGEKPPKARWAVAVIGLVLLVAGYVLANIVKNPIFAILAFFGAVILVIAATYMLFISGSVVICKLLKKNKKYYYKTNHFVSTSQMAFRMKRNGAGLASICILATMALVTISSTSGLYFGSEEIMRRIYPRDLNYGIESDDMEYVENCRKAITETAQENNVEPKNIVQYRFLRFENHLGFYLDYKMITSEQTEKMTSDEVNKLYNSASNVRFYIIPISDYNSVMGTNLTVNKGEALVLKLESEPKNKTYDLIPVLGELITEDRYDDDGKFIETVKFNDMEFLKGVGTVDDFVVMDGHDIDELSINAAALQNAPINRYAFINDEDFELQYKRGLESRNEYGIQYEDGKIETGITSVLNNYIGMDLDCSDDMIEDFMVSAFKKMHEYEPENTIANGKEYAFNDHIDRWGIFLDRKEMYALYGGLFFLGVLFCIVFILAAVMIMYYKQVTEGYEDKSKFEILQKVGMTKHEIRSSINSQVLTLFFLPLAAACVHIAFAFPLISRLLSLFGPMDIGFLTLVTIGCILLYAAVYVLAYIRTSRIYYKIVS